MMVLWEPMARKCLAQFLLQDGLSDRYWMNEYTCSLHVSFKEIGGRVAESLPFHVPHHCWLGLKGGGYILDAFSFPLQASQALCTLLPLGPYRKAVAQFFPQLLMALILQLFYSSNLRLMTEDRPLWDTRGFFRLNKKCASSCQTSLLPWVPLELHNPMCSIFIYYSFLPVEG